MKTIDFFCASQASTAVSLPTADQPSSAAIDRHNPIISDHGRKSFTSRTFPNPPCSSQYSPINPLPYHHLHAAASAAGTPNVAADQIGSGGSATLKGQNKKKTNGKKSSSIIRTDIARWSCAKPSDMATATPPSSMRYLLNDKSIRDGSMDRLSPSIISTQTNQKLSPNIENSDQPNPTTEIVSLEDSRTSPPSIKVVVLRASLHCRGCERKLKKHLSKMEGVNSFNIDFAAKKVTIMGNITPEGVLESVSKVKNAQFWPSAHHPTSSFLQNPNNLNHQQSHAADLLKKDL